MTETSHKEALHVATFSGWYRFEQDGKEFRQTKRDLTYWTLTCMSVDPDSPHKIYAGSEHSGLFYTENAGNNWKRSEPNTPKMMLFSALALNGGVMVGTIPSAVYRSKNGGWEELEGVRKNSAGANFPPSPELQSRARYLSYDIAGGCCWVGSLTLGGYFLGSFVPNIGQRIHWVIAAVVLLSFVPPAIAALRARNARSRGADVLNARQASEE